MIKSWVHLVLSQDVKWAKTLIMVAGRPQYAMDVLHGRPDQVILGGRPPRLPGLRLRSGRFPLTGRVMEIDRQGHGADR